MPNINRRKESAIKMKKSFKREVSSEGIATFSCDHRQGMSRKEARLHYMKDHLRFKI